MGNNSSQPASAEALLGAADSGDVDAVSTQLRRGADPNATTLNGSTALMIAVQNRRASVVQALLAARGVDVNAVRSSDGAFALFTAAEFTRGLSLSPAELVAALDIVVALVQDKRVDINMKMPDGRTALAAAAGHGHVPVVKALLAHPNIDVNVQVTGEGSTPLHMAAQADASVAGEIASLLLAHPAIDPTSAKPGNGATPLHQSACLGNAALARALLACAAVDPNVAMATTVATSADSGMTALGYASLFGHEAVVQALLAHPAIEVDRTNQGGLSPLRLAVVKKHRGVGRLLVEAGANLDALPKMGQKG